VPTSGGTIAAGAYSADVDGDPTAEPVTCAPDVSGHFGQRAAYDAAPSGAVSTWTVLKASKAVLSCNPRLGRFDPCAAPLSRKPHRWSGLWLAPIGEVAAIMDPSKTAQNRQLLARSGATVARRPLGRLLLCPTRRIEAHQRNSSSRTASLANAAIIPPRRTRTDLA
jgi:hypothetical protein